MVSREPSSRLLTNTGPVHVTEAGVAPPGTMTEAELREANAGYFAYTLREFPFIGLGLAIKLLEDYVHRIERPEGPARKVILGEYTLPDKTPSSIG